MAIITRRGINYLEPNEHKSRYHKFRLLVGEEVIKDLGGDGNKLQNTPIVASDCA